MSAVEVTDEMVAAAWKVWMEAGGALPYEGARVRDYIKPGMAPPERGAALTAMWDEDLRQAQACDDLMRRVIAAALSAI